MIHFREHRGSLEESLDTLIRVDTREELIEHIAKILKPYRLVKAEQVEFKNYGFDPRIEWQTLLVSVRDYGPVGFAMEVADSL